MDYEVLVDKLKEIATAVNAFSSEGVQLEAFRALLEAAGHKRGGARRPLKPSKRRKGINADAQGSSPKRAKAKKRRSGRPHDAPQLDKQLNLRPRGKKPFVEFCNEKDPANNSEFYAVAISYLREELGLKEVNVNHVYTCMRDAKERVPSYLWSNMRSCASRQGYIDTADGSNLKVTPRGVNLVLHDLPRSKE